jgi:hypothetical protein
MNVQYAFQKTRGGAKSGCAKAIQDHGFVWCDEETHRYVFGIADGHGKIHGRFISATLTEFMVATIEANASDLTERNILPFITRLFNCAEVHLIKSILKRLERQGLEIKILDTTDEIYWRKPESRSWNMLEGGSSIAITFILGNSIITAQTGNCYSTIMSKEAVLENHDFGIMYDAGNPTKYTFTAKPNAATKSLNLTVDHSPNCPEEYSRLLKSSYKPKMFYDEIDGLPYKRIFFRDGKKDDAGGNYYRNKEKEFATVVLIEDGTYGISSTRSFLNTSFKPFGVSHKPVITKVDMEAVWRRSDCNKEVFALLLGTNGIYDNWIRSVEKAVEVETSELYCLGEFLLHGTCMEVVLRDGEGAFKVLKSFMERNTVFAERHFGDKYDESAGILVYFCKDVIPKTAFEYPDCVYSKYEPDEDDAEEEEGKKDPNEILFEAELYELDISNMSKLAF